MTFKSAVITSLSFGFILLSSSPAALATDAKPERKDVPSSSKYTASPTLPRKAQPGKAALEKLSPRNAESLQWSIINHGTDNQFMGGVIAGGGDLLPRHAPEPSILVDFWHFDRGFRDEVVHDEKLSFPARPTAKQLFHGLPIQLQLALPKSSALLESRLALWKQDSPFMIGLIEKSLRTSDWRVTAFPFDCQGRGSPSPDSQQNFPVILDRTQTLSAACFFAHRGIYLNDERINSLGKLSRAGMLLHELLRKVQSDFDLGYADAKLLEAVHLIMRTEPTAGASRLSRLLLGDEWRAAPLSRDDFSFMSTQACMESIEAPPYYRPAPELLEIQREVYRKSILSSHWPKVAPETLNRKQVCAALAQRKIISESNCLTNFERPESWNFESLKGAFDTAMSVGLLEQQGSSMDVPLWIQVGPQIRALILNQKVMLGVLARFGELIDAGYCRNTFMANNGRVSYLAVAGTSEFVRALVILNSQFVTEQGLAQSWDTSWSRRSLAWPDMDIEFLRRFGALEWEYKEVWAQDRSQYVDVQTPRRLGNAWNAMLRLLNQPL